MSLVDRAQHFRKQFSGSRMGYTLLTRVYRLHGVKKRRITWKKKANNRTEAEYKREKKKLLRQLEKARRDGYRIIYLDEAMFTKSALPKTEYCLPKQNLNIDKSQTNEPAMALLSGISKERGQELYMLFP